MPIYEFQCKTCGRRFEDILPVSQTDPPPCPTCGTNAKVEKLLSASAPRNATDSQGTSCAPRGGFS